MNYPYYPTQPNAYPTQMNVGATQPNAQIQQGGFMVVPNEDVVRNYPVAPGNCVTFKIEGKPIVMEKSMGFSQFDTPKVETYRLVKESAEEPQKASFDPQPILSSIEDIKGDIDSIWSVIEDIKVDRSKSEVTAKRTSRRKDEGDD